jgi:hypothetical protein
MYTFGYVSMQKYVQTYTNSLLAEYTYINFFVVEKGVCTMLVLMRMSAVLDLKFKIFSIDDLFLITNPPVYILSKEHIIEGGSS